MRLILIIVIILINVGGYSHAFGRQNLCNTISRFYSIVDKTQFDTLKGSDFTWIIYKPINDTLSYTPYDKRRFFIENLSAKQRALLYIWQLESAVIIGRLGFANFYYNYKSSYSETIAALKLVKDSAMIKILKGVNQLYLSKYKVINQKYKSGEWKYVQKQFQLFDNAFINKHQNTMKLLEGYIRLNADEFVKFKN